MRNLTDIEKEFEDNVIWVLRELKKEFMATPEDRMVCYEYQYVDGAPSVEDQRRAINYLQKESALTIEKAYFRSKIAPDNIHRIYGTRPDGHYVNIFEKQFDKVYNGYLHGSGPLFIFEKFDAERGILHFAEAEIVISKNCKETYTLQLLNTLRKDINKEWFLDEILEDWEHLAGVQNDAPKHRVYHAAQRVNRIILDAVDVEDFIEHNTTKFRINPLYVESL